MLKIKNIIFLCGVLAATLSSTEPVTRTSKKPLVTQMTPEEAQKKAFWQRRKKRKKFRLSKKTAAKIALALGITYVGITLLFQARERATEQKVVGGEIASIIFNKSEEAKKNAIARAQQSAQKTMDQRLQDADGDDQKDSVHHSDNIQSMIIGFTKLLDIQENALSFDFHTEIMDLIHYLNNKKCLQREKNRAAIISKACLLLGLEESKERQSHANFFQDAGMFVKQFNTTGAEILARTWHFVKNYKDASGNEEPGLKDIMVKALAQGVDSDGQRLCFTGKIAKICEEIWDRRIFSMEEKPPSPEVIIANLVKKYCNLFSLDYASSMIRLGREAYEDIKGNNRHLLTLTAEHIKKFKTDMQSYATLSDIKGIEKFLDEIPIK